MSGQERNREIFLARYGSEKHIDSLIDQPEYLTQIAENPSLTDKHKIQISANKGSDYHIDVAKRTIAVKSEHLPDEARHNFMTDENSNVRHAFSSRDDLRDHEIEHLSHDPSEGVISNIVRDSKNPENSEETRKWRQIPSWKHDLVMKFINNGPFHAQKALASSHDIPPKYIDHIANLNNETLDANLAKHATRMTIGQYERFANHPSAAVRTHLATKFSTPMYILHKLKDDPHDIVSTIAKNEIQKKEKYSHGTE